MYCITVCVVCGCGCVDCVHFACVLWLGCIEPFCVAREMIVRLILDAVDDVKSYADFELVLEIALALANDIGESVR